MNLENVADVYALSPMQAGMLFHVLNEPRSSVYFQQYTCRLAGPLQKTIFEAAWRQVVERHPILRTAFIWEELDEALQIVRQRTELPWAYQDWQAVDTAEQQTRLEARLQADRDQNMDLTQAPLLRFSLIRLKTNAYQFIWSFSHLILDGWSMSLLLQEVYTTYEALCKGVLPTSTEPRPYRDYIAWLQEQEYTETETYWKQTLKGFTVPTPLGITKHTHPISESGAEHKRQEIILSENTTLALQTMARKNQLTLNTLLQGAWALLLSYYSGEPEIVFGVTVSGRSAALRGFDEMIGLFINTLPLRVKLPPEASLLTWLKDLQTHHVETRQYECSPLASIQRWSEVSSGKALFDSIFVFENLPLNGSMDTMSSLLEIQDPCYLQQSNYPLAILAMPGSELKLIVIYKQDLFDEAVVLRLLDHLKTILESMLTRPDQHLSEVSLLTEAERHRLLVKWNDIRIADLTDTGIHQLFESQTAQQPDAVALISEYEQLAYKDLNHRANQLAHYLLSEGLKQGQLVAICMERSVDMIVALLSVLKTGSAYIPLDPDYPETRLAYIIEEAGVTMVLSRQNLSNKVANQQVQTLYLDTDWETIARASKENLNCQINPSDLAYVMYTSGSTGTPRGVQITHRNLVHSTTARMHYYPDPVNRFLLLSSFAFDSSAVGIYWSLCQGGTLVLPPPGEERDISKLALRITELGITHMLALPALYDLLLTYPPTDQLTSLRTVIVAGEACPGSLPERHEARLPQTTLYNEYGPTEGTIWSSVYKVPSNHSGTSVPIGYPIPNTQLYILDTQLRPVPIGVTGELFIGGEGVAAGYLNRPEETSEHFIEHDFGIGSSIRLYKTGDLARYQEEGCIEFLGRKDHQVKIRGYRIELEEIEATLAQHPALQEAVVVARADASPGTDGPASGPNTDILLNQLLTLGPEKAEQLLKEIEDLHDPQI